jgi:hypothetical protein
MIPRKEEERHGEGVQPEAFLRGLPRAVSAERRRAPEQPCLRHGEYDTAPQNSWEQLWEQNRAEHRAKP